MAASYSVFCLNMVLTGLMQPVQTQSMTSTYLLLPCKTGLIVFHCTTSSLIRLPVSNVHVLQAHRRSINHPLGSASEDFLPGCPRRTINVTMHVFCIPHLCKQKVSQCKPLRGVGLNPITLRTESPYDETLEDYPQSNSLCIP